MKRILTIIAILGICSTTMAQNHLFDTITFFRGGRLYKLKLYPDRYVINDTTYTAFPGYGVTHNTVPHGDSLPFMKNSNHHIVLRDPYDTVNLNYINALPHAPDWDNTIQIQSTNQADGTSEHPDRGYLYLNGDIQAAAIGSDEKNIGNWRIGGTGNTISFWGQALPGGIPGDKIEWRVTSAYPLGSDLFFNNSSKYSFRIDGLTWPGGSSSNANTAFGWGNWASGTLYPKRADSNAWTPYGYVTPFRITKLCSVDSVPIWIRGGVITEKDTTKAFIEKAGGFRYPGNGDVNGSSTLNGIDALYSNFYVKGLIKLTDLQKSKADFDGDGKITLGDGFWIQDAVTHGGLNSAYHDTIRHTIGTTLYSYTHEKVNLAGKYGSGTSSLTPQGFDVEANGSLRIPLSEKLYFGGITSSTASDSVCSLRKVANGVTGLVGKLNISSIPNSISDTMFVDSSGYLKKSMHLYPKRADSNAWTPYGYATPKSVYDGFVEWSHNFINVNDSTAKWGYAPWWGTNQALLGKEPSISKSTGFLKWTGSAWSWDNSTYVTTSDSRLSDSRAASDVYAWAKAATPPVVTSLSAGTYTITATYANSAGTAAACTGNAATVTNGVYTGDPRLTDSRVASDVYAWAKVASPPYLTGLSAGSYAISVTGSSASCTGNAATATTATTANGLASGSYSVSVTGSSGSCTGNAATVSNGVYKTDIDIIAWIGIDTTNISTTPTYFIKYSQGYIIDSIIYSVVRNAGSPDVTVKLWYGSNINSAGTALVTAGNQITSYAGQTKTGTINNATIAAGNVIWATFSAVAVKPKSIFITLKGHKI